MIERIFAELITKRLRQYPAVALVGPRQCGKTTLARSFKGEYFDLEQGPDRLRLNLRWDEVVQSKGLTILDEAQTWPEVFPRLRGAIDDDRKHSGRFLLLGSVSPALMTEVSESLAGRLAILELPPFLISELHKTPLQRLWLCGGFPEGGVRQTKRFPQWQQNYTTLLAQRDLPAWGLPAKPQETLRLFKMLSAVHGQIWNSSQIGQSLGLSYHTVNRYLDFLEGAFLVRRLPSYQANLKKRLVKSPKVYWRDSGLLHATQNVKDEEMLLAQPWVGASWEGFVIEQILGMLGAADRRTEAYFLRTSNREEIDLVLDFGGRKWAVEIKLTSAPNNFDLDNLNKTADLIKADKRILVSQASASTAAGEVISCNLPWLASNLEKII